MLGAVSADGREPVLPLTLLGFASAGFARRRITAETIVDTGFDGELTLASGLIRDLGYPYAGFTRATLADGSAVRFDHYEGRVLWHGREREILVLAADGDPLAGMTLLKGSELRIRAQAGGEVVVEELPS